MTTKTKDLMVLKKETADIVLSKVQQFQKKGELDLPPNYSAANALKSAWLILQETVDKDKKPALSVCTKPSIANALLNMVVQGLNPAKAQCYFIVYGTRLTLMRSYQGSKAVCLRVNKDLKDIFAEVVYQDDSLEYELKKGRRIIVEHKQKLTNIDDGKILAAYAVAIGNDDEVKRSELMTFDQIKQAWKQSKMKPVNDDGTVKPGSTHGKFTAELCKRTVTNRLSKHIIGASSDEDLVIRSVKESDDELAEASAEAEIDEFADTEVIDINGHEVTDETQDLGTQEQDDTEPETDDTSDEMSQEEKDEIMAKEAAEAESEQRESAGPGF